MALSTQASKSNSDAGTDDPAQSILTDLAGLVDKFNTTLTHLASLTYIASGLSLGDGLEVSSTTFRIKLPSGSGLLRGSTGLSLDKGSSVGTTIQGTRFRQANVITKSTDFNVTSTDEGNLFVYTSSGSATVTLPSLSASLQDKAFHFYVSGSGSLTIDGNGADTVDGNANVNLPANSWATVISDNTNSDNHTSIGGLFRTGKHTAAIRAPALYSHPSGTGAGQTTIDPGSSVGKPSVQVAAFDDSAENVMCFGLKMPKSWDEGSLDCYVNWTVDGTSTGSVRWEISALSRGDGDSWNTSFGSGTAVTDARQGQWQRHRSPVISVTSGGTPADDDEVIFKLRRVVGSSLDTLSTTALVSAVEVLINYDTGNDN